MSSFILQVARHPAVIEHCVLDLRQESSIVLTATCVHLGVMNFSGVDLFEILIQLRLRLEEDGYVLLCNAARKDAYPSRMAREMGGGRRLYVLKHGVHARRADLVDALEPASWDQVATVSEQRDFYESWVRSLSDDT